MNSKRILSAFLVAMVLMGAFGGAAPAASGYVTATGGDSYIRTGPGLGYAQVGILYKGSSASYLGDYSYDGRGVKWYRVRHGYDTGWVSSRYTDLYASSYDYCDDYDDYDYDNYDYDYDDYGYYESGTCVEATGRVNVRSGPGLGYSDVGTLVKGEKVPYLGQTSYDDRGVLWYKIQFYSDGEAWVSSVYGKLSYGSPGDPSDGADICGSYVKATGGNSNLRAGPSLDSKDLGTMHTGDTATYLGDYSVDERGVTWYYVNFNGKIGWVSSRYTTLY